jgi:probable rRNA maturation factor
MAKKPRNPRNPEAKLNLSALENRQRSVGIELHVLAGFLARVNREIGLAEGSVFIRFVDDSEMARLNQTFRKKRETTDVLSFPTEARHRPRQLRSRPAKLLKGFLGDIAISPRIARRNAKSLGRTFSGELQILILHGVLHLLGYDHESDRGEMERIENRLRRRLGLIS